MENGVDIRSNISQKCLKCSIAVTEGTKVIKILKKRDSRGEIKVAVNCLPDKGDKVWIRSVGMIDKKNKHGRMYLERCPVLRQRKSK